MKCYENYPVWMIVLSNTVSLLIYAIGAFIISQIGIIWLVFYLLFVAVLELRLLGWHCVDCYYYGKYCAFGKGKLSSLFFRKGNAKRFAGNQLCWKDIVPDFLVFIMPAIIGIVLLIMSFDWFLLLLLLLLVLLGFFGTAFIRSRIACRYCKQRKLGCPAEKLFSKTK